MRADLTVGEVGIMLEESSFEDVNVKKIIKTGVTRLVVLHLGDPAYMHFLSYLAFAPALFCEIIAGQI